MNIRTSFGCQRLTHKQRCTIIDFMKANPQLARGYPKDMSGRYRTARKWEQFTKVIHAADPRGPHRTPKSWAQHFNMLKSRLKKKFIHYDNQGISFHNSSVFTNYEKCLISILWPEEVKGKALELENFNSESEDESQSDNLQFGSENDDEKTDDIDIEPKYGGIQKVDSDLKQDSNCMHSKIKTEPLDEMSDNNRCKTKRNHLEQTYGPRVTLKQMCAMIKFMEANPQLARGYPLNMAGQHQSQKKWEQCTKVIHAADPKGAHKSPKNWVKYYITYKARTKKKYLRSKCQGISYEQNPDFTNNEKTLISILWPDNGGSNVENEDSNSASDNGTYKPFDIYLETEPDEAQKNIYTDSLPTKSPYEASYQQLVAMASFLETHPQLATGFSAAGGDHHHFRSLWEECTKLLNAADTTRTKTPKEWAVYFKLFKSKLKMKQKGNITKNDDGFTDIENVFVKIFNASDGGWNLKEMDDEELDMVFGGEGHSSIEPQAFIGSRSYSPDPIAIDEGLKPSSLCEEIRGLANVHKRIAQILERGLALEERRLALDERRVKAAERIAAAEERKAGAAERNAGAAERLTFFNINRRNDLPE